MSRALVGEEHQQGLGSFDWKDCVTDKFIEQKLNYIHENPCRGKWNLAIQPEDYVHSSARYYNIGKHSAYEATSYSKLEDVDLTEAKIE